MKNTLIKIAKELNKEQITWAIGASVLLNFYKLIDNPNDIDIIIEISDIEKANKVLKNIGHKKTCKESDSYSSKYFFEYEINKIDIDVMAGFVINYGSNKQYLYEFNKKSITDILNINNVEIPLTSLEDWYVLYSLMTKREDKVKLIEKYFRENGIRNFEILKKHMSKKDIPKEVKENITKLLKINN
ncbi:hypothetical protein GM661_07760 [Iocasia frigidifontis]|uniref:Uncharacterized protein n=1 Tax=Iocasia fonsfrigidae TaxID=2682810 RepID=A0A8A7K7W7_9FIRM|nr:hypothetical protein [Iocasia fonsfrigidae]QTL97883.1 hypothetical protein GM661_07760 [Iocasia fonsfrigidae]